MSKDTVLVFIIDVPYPRFDSVFILQCIGFATVS